MAAAEYKLITMPRADQQVRDLLHRAATQEIRDDLINALKAVAANLRSKPGQFGDPLHQTRKKGGMVYGKVVQPVYVRFAVFDSDRNVFLLEVRPLGRFFPE